jgi:K+:H+ antiporter subunit KhtT
MKLHEADLPGIGKKFTLYTGKRIAISLVVHNTGKREIYLFPAGEEEEASCVLELSDEEARQLGTLLMGAFFTPVVVDKDKIDLLLKGLVIEWIELSKDSPAVGKSINELAIRTRTGASVIAILRNEKDIIPSPSPEEVFKVRDTLIAVGTREQISSLVELITPRPTR